MSNLDRWCNTIDSAPKDGSVFLAVEGDDWYQCRWSLEDKKWGTLLLKDHDSNPSHWIPLTKLSIEDVFCIRSLLKQEEDDDDQNY